MNAKTRDQIADGCGGIAAMAVALFVFGGPGAPCVFKLVLLGVLIGVDAILLAIFADMFA